MIVRPVAGVREQDGLPVPRKRQRDEVRFAVP